MLLELVQNLPFEPFRIGHLVDQRRRYQLDLDPRFPLVVKLYSFSDFTDALRFNWHERLELFVSVAGRGRFRMGDRTMEFSRGDVVVVDNLKLHGLIDCEGPLRHGIVFEFLPELVCGPGSYRCDLTYLYPFYYRKSGVDPVLRSHDRLAAHVHAALGKLVECYSGVSSLEEACQARCKAHLLEALCYLAQHFGLTEGSVAEIDSRRREPLQFGRLYEYLRGNFAEQITVTDAAAMVGMSEFRFMKFFRRTTGMTFIPYITHLRLGHAHRLLTESKLSIAEIAAAAGFADQSYFDRRFRQHYKQTPRGVRASAGLSE